MARMATASVAVAAVAALTVAGVAQRGAVTASFTVLGHLQWPWLPAALLLESASMAAFAIMLRGLLAAGGASVGIRPMLATAYAANAVSVSVPLAGPSLATAFTFRRFTRQGADAPLAGWSLLVGGVISAAAAAIIVVGGALVSGNTLVTAVTVLVGVLAVAILVAAAAAVRRPWLRAALERPAGWMLRQGSQLLRRRAADPVQTIRACRQRLVSLRLPPSGWITATGLALANWLADAAVLAVSIRATGATVPWHDLLLVYGSGIAAQSLNITPGGLGVAEGSLSLALDSRGITRAVLVGHSYGGGVALSAASMAPGRVEAVVLLASVGPGCLTVWDRLLAAPGAGPLCAQVVPFRTARRLARALPDARLMLVEGAGHNLPRRAHAVVADAIVAFLSAAPIPMAAGHLDSHLGGARTLILPGRIGPATRESAWQKSASGSSHDGPAFR